MKKDVRELREALLDLVGVINRPQPDSAVLEAAGIDLERALFPLLARIARHGPLGIVELAQLVGRDYTTVSRQVTRLESLGLIARSTAAGDRRVRAAVITERGRAMTVQLESASQKIIEKLLAHWQPAEVRTLARLMRRAADDALEWSRTL